MAKGASPTLSGHQLAAASRIFSTGVVRQLARRGCSPLLARIVREAEIESWVSPECSVSSLFDRTFTRLRNQYRSEYIYRVALTQKILLGIHSLRTATMLSEFRIGPCKADLVILNGTSTAYEIKSELDGLERLDAQVSAYRQVFANVNVVSAEQHCAVVMKRVPADVGVLKLTRRNCISFVRRPTEDTRRLVPQQMFESLQLSESRKILDLHGVRVPDVPNTQRHAAQKELFLTLPTDSIHAAMCKTLKKSRSQLPLESLLDSIPVSLRHSVLAVRPRLNEVHRIRMALKTPLNVALTWA